MAQLPPPAEKLPLAVRKNFRDEWESSKEAKVEKGISDLMGEAWTVTTNPNQIYVLPEDESYKSRPGEVLSWYMEEFLSNLKTFITKYGDDGKNELNTLCAKHVVELAPQDKTEYSYGGLEVRDGVLRLVFGKGNLATNCSAVSQDFAGPLSSASEALGGSSALDIHARKSIAESWDQKVEEVRTEIGKQVGVVGIKLEPNWEQNATLLKAAGKHTRDDWNTILGAATLDYFDNFSQNLKYAKFEGDDMLQEGFQEAVPKNVVGFRIVEKLVGSGYNEVILEDGKILIQTTPENFWTNVGAAGDKIIDIL